jgi:hypothetical protein
MVFERSNVSRMVFIFFFSEMLLIFFYSVKASAVRVAYLKLPGVLQHWDTILGKEGAQVGVSIPTIGFPSLNWFIF